MDSQLHCHTGEFLSRSRVGRRYNMKLVAGSHRELKSSTGDALLISCDAGYSMGLSLDVGHVSEAHDKCCQPNHRIKHWCWLPSDLTLVHTYTVYSFEVLNLTLGRSTRQ